ncbi:hypothetical protein [Clostridium sp.]|nr:hypothetical protein [Clostridium sp.]
MEISKEKIFEIIDKEMEFAKQINPQMAFGMLQIKTVLEEHFEEEE